MFKIDGSFINAPNTCYAIEEAGDNFICAKKLRCKLTKVKQV